MAEPHRRDRRSPAISMGSGSNSPSGSTSSFTMGSAHRSPSLLETLGSSQNLPALLNDPKKGKQRDFFTRHWGDSFTENSPIAPSPFVCELPPKSFDKYLKKLRRHRHREQFAEQQRQLHSPAKVLDATVNYKRVGANIPQAFLDPNFDLSKPETFATIFQISKDENLAEQVNHARVRLVEEKLTHQIDLVEDSIQLQCSQKSQSFFQVMTYHRALMEQLSSLVELIRSLRSKLKLVDEDSLKPSLELCKLKRRQTNLTKLLDKLQLMSFLHQTQPTIQLMLSTSEFSGALDLITTACEILSVDLRGICSFQHMTNQLQEIENVIGRVLLQDFQSFIAAEINKEMVHVKATTLNGRYDGWNDFDTDQLKSVIFGLLRKNSYTFLEALEDASTAAIKTVLADIIKDLSVNDEDQPGTTITIMSKFAKSATSEEWTDLFDVLIGSLLVLLNRIYVIQNAISDAINSTTDSQGKDANQIVVPKAQLDSLLSTNKEVLWNICEQMHERLAKLLTQRSKPESVELIKTEELTSMSFLVSIFSDETRRISGKPCSGLPLSLQSQSVLFVQTFHEDQKKTVRTHLDKELWKKTDTVYSSLISKMNAIPSMRALFENSIDSKTDDKDETVPTENGVSTKPPPGEILLSGDDQYVVVECTSCYLRSLTEYCNLCSMLPNVTIDLGLKVAEQIMFFNSRVFQLIIGCGIVHLEVVKTVTIKHMAHAMRTLELSSRVMPYVLLHFQESYTGKTSSVAQKAVNGASPGSTKTELKQFETLQKRFEKVSDSCKNQIVEFNEKIVFVSWATIVQMMSNWLDKHVDGARQTPSAEFKQIGRHITILLQSLDVLPQFRVKMIFQQVHKKFLSEVQNEVNKRNISFDSSLGRGLEKEMMYYVQCVKRLNVLPPEKLDNFQRNYRMLFWKDDFCDSDESPADM